MYYKHDENQIFSFEGRQKRRMRHEGFIGNVHHLPMLISAPSHPRMPLCMHPPQFIFMVLFIILLQIVNCEAQVASVSASKNQVVIVNNHNSAYLQANRKMHVEFIATIFKGARSPQQFIAPVDFYHQRPLNLNHSSSSSFITALLNAIENALNES